MAISVDWPNKIINIPQSYLTLVSGNVYSLDTDQLRLDLRALEDDEQGIVWERTHVHFTEQTLSGVTYARLVKFINGYTVTFEAGAYVVTLTGSNNNILDVLNPNGVSVLGNNSAGLQTVTSGSGLSTEQATQLQELWKRQGLDVADKVTITPTQISTQSGDIDLALSGDGVTQTVVERQP
jgi:hypothetical protein